MAYSAKLRSLFPHASQEFFSKNPDIESQLQDPKPKQIPIQSLDEVLPGKEKSNVRAHLVITSFTTRLKDEDNLKGGCKALIDCIKTLHLIDDDDPGSLKLTVKQIKVGKRKYEHTRVRITYEQ